MSDTVAIGLISAGGPLAVTVIALILRLVNSLGPRIEAIEAEKRAPVPARKPGE